MFRRFGDIMTPLSRNKNASSKGVKYSLNKNDIWARKIDVGWLPSVSYPIAELTYWTKLFRMKIQHLEVARLTRDVRPTIVPRVDRFPLPCNFYVRWRENKIEAMHERSCVNEEVEPCVSPVSIWSLRSLGSLRKKKFSDRSDHMETTLQRSLRQRSLRWNFFYVRDRCHCDRWRVVSIWLLWSLRSQRS